MTITRSIAAGVALLALSGGAEAQQQFNGRWSVLVVTERGACDKAYRYPIAIENGQVRYAGDAGFNITGDVERSGAVQGSIAQGQMKAAVRGKLADSTGAGTWAINGARDCSGSWSAEKRS